MSIYTVSTYDCCLHCIHITISFVSKLQFAPSVLYDMNIYYQWYWIQITIWIVCSVQINIRFVSSSQNLYCIQIPISIVFTPLNMLYTYTYYYFIICIVSKLPVALYPNCHLCCIRKYFYIVLRLSFVFVLLY